METKHLEETLAELEAELEAGGTVDERTRAALARLAGTIATVLEEDDGTAARDERRETLADMLQDEIEHFEVDHPKLTMVLSRLANTLSGMGI